MNIRKFNKRTFGETLTLICRLKGGEYWKINKTNPSKTGPNQKFLAANSKCDQPAISRAIRGESALTYDRLASLAKFLQVSTDQLMGNVPIESIDGDLNPEDAEFINQYRQSPDDLRKALRAFYDAYQASGMSSEGERQQ